MASNAIIAAQKAIKQHVEDITKPHRDKEDSRFEDPSRPGKVVRTGKLYKYDTKDPVMLHVTSDDVYISVYEEDGTKIGGYSAHTLIKRIK